MPPKKENMVIKLLKDNNIDDKELLQLTPNYRKSWVSIYLAVEGLL